MTTIHRINLSVLSLLSSASAFAATMAPRPNVIVVYPDQWRASAFGYAGDPNVQTPHLDRLERESVHFFNAVAGVPVCTPSRASLLTGQRTQTHSLFINDVPLAADAVTIAKVLREHGYDTGYIGKWHLDGRDRSLFIARERRQGFDYWKALECTHNYNESYYYADGPDKLKWDGYDALAQTRDAAEYLRDHANAAKPFFLFLSWGPPHTPYHTAPEKFRALYAPEKMLLPPNVPPDMSQQAREMLAGYYAHCSALDACVGELRDALKKTGLAENTILIFTSDHGDMLGSHGGRNKQQPYDESVRVPLLLHWPAGLGVKPRRLDAPINSEDIMPTILGLCGVPSPASVEGLDFSRYVRGGESPSDNATLLSCVVPFGQWDRKNGGQEYRGLRTSRYTYVRNLAGPWLLFDNENDPYQLTNLVGRTEHAKLQAKLDATLMKKLASTQDVFLPGSKYLEQWGYRPDGLGFADRTNYFR